MPSLRPSRYRWRKAIWIALVAALLALAPSAQADTKASRPQFGWLVRAFLQGPPPTTGVFVAAPSPTGSSVCATSTCCYVKDGGTATGTNGCFSAANFANADWGNAAKFYDQVSQAEAVITRGTGTGNYILVADGAYNNEVTFNVAASGTVPITILKATDSSACSACGEHGTSTGWASTMGNGQALLGVGITSDHVWEFDTPYWVVDGVIGDGSTSTSGDDPAIYGFYIQTTATGDLHNVTNGDSGGFNGVAHHITIKHFASKCNGTADLQQMAFVTWATFATYDHVYTSGCGGAFWGQATDETIQYSYLGFNIYPSAANNHGNQMYGQDRMIVRWNWVATCHAQCIEPSGASETNIEDCAIYGNVFIDTPEAGDGMIKGTSSGHMSNCVLYNNTVVRGTQLFKQSNNGEGSGNIVANNLFWQSEGCCNDAGGSAIDKKYNAYFASGQPYGESNEQNGGSGNPFAAGAPPTCTASGPTTCAIGDYHLTSATTAGLTLGSPYNVDMFGVTRGADGTWDRGAIEKP